MVTRLILGQVIQVRILDPQPFYFVKTAWPHRLARPRTLDSHSSGRGSNPLGATRYKTGRRTNMWPVFIYLVRNRL